MYKSTDNKEFKTISKLIEYETNNGLTKDDVIANIYFNGIRPLCNCGCNKKSKYNRATKQFNSYLHGHGFKMMDNPSTGTKGTQKAKDKMKIALDTKQKMIKDGTFINWNMGQTAETNDSIKKVADSQRNIPRSSEDKEKITKGRLEFIQKLKDSGEYKLYNQHMKKYWADPIHRNEQRQRTTNRLINNNYSGKTSKTEEIMKLILDDLEIKYIHQIAIEGKIYDFLINDNIIIEVDGHFYHADPRVFPNGPEYPIQIKTVENDKIKNEIAKKLGYKLIRIWDTDILKSETFDILNEFKKV